MSRAIVAEPRREPRPDHGLASSKRKALAWVAGIVCIAAALGISVLMPDQVRAEDPFVVSTGIGEQGVGRALAVTVTDIGYADEISLQGWKQAANWLVIEAEVMGREKEYGNLLGFSELKLADGRLYRASERLPESLARAQLLVGIPQSGAIAFELPAEASGLARLRLGVNADSRLDSVIEFAIDLDAVTRIPSRELPVTGWAGS